MIGRIFDVKEFAVHDGAGVRVTVFMKGCPMRCEWCHNPEGLSYEKNLFFYKNKCVNCGLCYQPCAHQECRPFDRCVHVCPNHCLKIIGQDYTVKELVDRLLRYKTILEKLGGGITFSGGEPFYQWAFLNKVVDELKRNNVDDIAIETCGLVKSEVFQKIASKVSMVILDMKIFDKEKHIRYTKSDNTLIKENFLWLKNSKTPYIIRTPLIKGITDTTDNLEKIQSFIGDSNEI